MHSATPSTWLRNPRQFGPSNAIPEWRAVSLIACCSLNPAAPVSAKPDANTIAPPMRRRPQAATASRMAAPGRHSTARSMSIGRSSIEGAQGRPNASLRLRLTRWMAPWYSKLLKLDSMVAPNDPGSGDIPTMAIDAGRSNLPTRMRLVLTASSVPTGFTSILGGLAAKLESPRPHARLGHDAGPFFIFTADEFAEFRGAAGHRLGAHGANPIPCLWIAQRRHDRGVERGNDLGRGAGWGHEPEPAY